MDLEKLKTPFAPEDIEWRVQRSGVKNGKPWAMVLAYVTNRAIQDRLDAVVGPGGWQNSFAPGPHGGVICRIAIKVDGEWVEKWDGADNTDIEAIKGGLSGSMKRTGVQWGIGRYLYKLETGWANIHDGGSHRDRVKDSSGKVIYYRWDPPALPSWALPKDTEVSAQAPDPEPQEESLEALKQPFTDGCQQCTDKIKRSYSDVVFEVLEGTEAEGVHYDKWTLEQANVALAALAGFYKKEVVDVG